MINQCEFPLCQFNSKQGSTFCTGHDKNFGGTKTVEKPKRISMKSVKRIVAEKLYKKIVKEMFADSNKCELQAPGCQGVATGLHHQRKRAGKFYLDKRYLKRACNNCNNFCEQYPLQAIKKGYSLSKF